MELTFVFGYNITLFLQTYWRKVMHKQTCRANNFHMHRKWRRWRFWNQGKKFQQKKLESKKKICSLSVFLRRKQPE